MTVTHETRIGTLYLEASDVGLTLLGFSPPEEPATPSEAGDRIVAQACAELDAYLDGTLREFTVPVDLSGLSAAHRRVLDGLAPVGWGQTITYGDLATSVGLPVSESRRVGGAMARNPVAIVVPCHRVVGSDGSLTGYAGGLERKRTLLDLEAADRMLF
ncbi:methylated-DNA--[protein]-cysteine S-methyltransferase [Actinomycetospora endophytica]|uniref:Methylated-DNA--[protein]-cysteine S-methyltransferase n=1 Tax=Actinomycetospora endophytica TaxID=2291215 RepID=A0ABS8P7F3_9PSEU|nr:methylated-DNA--[protein]-cysteine S-methyltransferase [Actinomycetospora endophytica]MCD2194205.1 methylated-DNA--[protein]-cysteine S-methyltransferase [Actinomycetospora endophytica]